MSFSKVLRDYPLNFMPTYSEFMLKNAPMGFQCYFQSVNWMFWHFLTGNICHSPLFWSLPLIYGLRKAR